jgi:hypothetical protein
MHQPCIKSLLFGLMEPIHNIGSTVALLSMEKKMNHTILGHIMVIMIL